MASGLGTAGQQVPNSGASVGGGNAKFIGNNDRWNNTAQTDHPVRAFIDRYTPQLGQQLTTSDAQGVAKKFPNMIEKGDPRDDYYAFKSGLINDQGIIPGAGLAVASDADIGYLRKKGDDTIEAAFKGFLLDEMDLSSPEKQDYWQKNFPGVFQEKMKLVESQLDLQLKLAKLRIMGPRSEEDYMLLFAIQHGYIAIPQGPVFDPDKLEKTDFHRGLFNVKKWLLTDANRTVSRVDPLQLSGRGNYPTVTSTANFSDINAKGTGAGYGTGLSVNMTSNPFFGRRR